MTDEQKHEPGTRPALLPRMGHAALATTIIAVIATVMAGWIYLLGRSLWIIALWTFG